jgi:hypothetical protein
MAWWSVPHMLVAEIAYQHLNPTAKAKVDVWVKEFHSMHEGYDTFAKISLWMDDVEKVGRLPCLKPCHYFTTCYAPKRPDYHDKQLGDAGVNVVVAINNARRGLSVPNVSPWERSLHLAMLLHCTGDVHQPMHCASHFSENSDKHDGDRGGNRHKVRGARWRNLHQVWDDGGGTFPRVERVKGQSEVTTALAKFNPSSYAELLYKEVYSGEEGDTLKSVHASVLDPSEWAKESYAHVPTCYELEHGGVPSLEYIEKVKKICRVRVAMAGLRLAEILNQDLGGGSQVKQTKSK